MNKKYKNPPIREVVCEFKFEGSNNWDLNVNEYFYDKLQASFPKKEQGKIFETELIAGPDGVQQQIKTEDRMKFSTEDEKTFVQLSPYWLTIHRLSPYLTWEQFVPVVKEALEAYNALVPIQQFQRVGLRYVNEIILPSAKVDLADYFNFYPNIGNDLPQEFGPFIVGIQIPHNNTRDALRLQMSTGANDDLNKMSIILDLDYYLIQNEKISIDNVIEWLEQAHNNIISTFEGCINDRTRDILEGR